jgi:mono/diheme cytochrome c family protein
MISILAAANQHRKMAGCTAFNRLVDQDMMIFNNNLGLPMHCAKELFSLIFVAALATSAAAADVRKGETLAKRWCATCHVVAADQQVATTQSPAFSTIARNPDFSEATLALFLLSPHPRMPDMNLSRSEAADLSAYIRTQR